MSRKEYVRDPRDWMSIVLALDGHEEAAGPNRTQRFDETGDILSGLEIYLEAESILSRHVRQKTPGSEEMMVDLRLNKAMLPALSDDVAGGIAECDMAVELLQKHPMDSTARMLQAAQVYSRKAILMWESGDTGALEFHDRAIELYASLFQQCSDSESALRLSQCHIHKAVSLMESGALQDSLAEFDTARAILNNPAHSIPDHQKHQLLGFIGMNEANALFLLGDYSRCIQKSDQALVFYSAADSTGGMDSNDTARVYINKANALGALRRKWEALLCLDAVIDIYEPLVFEKKQRSLLLNLLIAYMNKSVQLNDVNRREEALELINRTLAMIQQLVDLEGRQDLEHYQAVFLTNKGNKTGSMGNHEVAADCFRESVAVLERLVSERGRTSLENYLYANQINLIFSQTYLKNFDAALALIDKVQDELETRINIQGKREYLQLLKAVYSGRIDIYTALNR